MVDSARGVLTVDLLEVASVGAVIAAAAAIEEDPAFRSDLNICIECCYLRRAPTADQVRELASTYAVYAAPKLTGRCAIVAGWSWLYDSAREFAAVAGAMKARVRVFQSSAEAHAWLEPEAAPPPSVRDNLWVTEARALHAMARRAGLPRP